MTIKRAIRYSTLLGCMVASLVYAHAQGTDATNMVINTSATPAEPTTTAGESAKNIRFQFDGIPYMTVVERFAQMANKPLLTDVTLEGTVKFSDPEPYSYQEALDTLNLILSMKNATLVEQDRYLRLLPLDKLKQTPIKVLKNLEERGDVRPGEIVTVALNFKNLDPNEIAQSTTTMLSNAGSVFPTGRSRGIIITDRIENIERIQKLLLLADVAPQSERQMKTFNILSASGPVLTDLINRTFGIATAPIKNRYNQEKNKYMPLPPSPEDYVTAVWDEASRTMVIFGPNERVDMAEELINRFENKEGVAPSEVRIFYPVEMRPQELASTIRQMVTGIAAQGEKDSSSATKARLVVDERLGRLIVTTPVAGQMESIEKVIRKVDPAATGEVSTTVTPAKDMKIYYPKHVTVAELDSMLRQSVSGIAAPGEKVSNKTRLIQDAKQRRLLVISNDPEQMSIIENVIQTVDSEGEKKPVLTDTKIFYPKRMTPSELVTLLCQMVTGIAAPGENAPDKAKLIVDPALDRLVVMTSNAELMGAIEQAIEKVDVSETDATESVEGTSDTASLEKNETRVVQLQYGVAAEIGGLITKTFTDRRTGLKVLIDARSNSLVLNGKAGALQAAYEVINSLDVQSSSVTGRQIRFIEVQGDPSYLANLSNQLYAEQQRDEGAAKTMQERRRQQMLGGPRIIPEPLTNRLIIVGSDEEQEKIKKIVEDLDLKSGGNAGIKVFHLRGTNPYEMSGILTRYLNTYREKRKGGPRASVFVDSHNNSLVVCGTAADIQQASTLIDQIDTNQDREARCIKVFTVRSDQDVGSQMNRLRMLYIDQLKAKPNAGAADAVFIPDYSSNSITVAASESQMKMMEELMKLLQGDSMATDKEFRQFQLIGMDPGLMQGALQMAFANDGRSRTSRPWIYQDWRNNKLFVYGRSADIQKAEMIIKELDGSSPEDPRVLKIFEVKVSDPWSLVGQVQVLFRDQIRGQGKNNGSQALFLADSGRLIVAAAQSQIPIIEKIVNTLNQEGKVESELRVFKLKTANVRNVYPMVQHVLLYRGGPRSRGVQPGITMDAQSNSLAIYGKPVDIAQVEMILSKLDGAEMSQPKEMKTYRITSRNVDRQVVRIQSLYRAQLQSRPELGTVDPIFIPDNDYGRMTVAATKDQLAVVDEIIAALDDKTALPDMQLRLLQPTNGNNQEIANALNFVVRARRSQRTGPAPWIAPEMRTGGIYVFGMEDDIAYAEQLIKEFDSAGEGLERIVRTYDIQYTGMAQFAQNVRLLYMDQMKGNSGLGSPDAFIQGDDYTGKLIVGVRKTQEKLLDDVITTLKEKSDAAEPTVQLIALKSARPSQLVPVLTTVIYSKTSRATISTRVTADDTNNRIIVSGSKGEVNRIGKLISQLDVPEVRDARLLRIFDVNTWDVWGYSERLRQLYRDQAKGAPEFGPADAIILPDDFSGRLIVAANEKQMPFIENIMQSLESELPERQMELRTYKLENIYTSQAIRTINTLMQGSQRMRGWGMRSGGNTRDSLNMSEDTDNNSIVAMGSPGKLAMLENIIKTIDQPPEKPDREVRFYTLLNADALDVELRLDGLFNDPNRPEKMIFESDLLSNTLTVMAREKDFVEIEELIQKFENVSRDQTEVVRLIPVTNMSVEQMAKILGNIYPQVSSVDLEVVDKLPPFSERVHAETPMGTVPSGMNPPEKVNGDEKPLPPGGPGARPDENSVPGGNAPEKLVTPAVTLAVDTNANALIVSGPSYEVDRIRTIVSQLQTSFVSGDSEIRMFRLKEADPVVLARTLNELFRNSRPSANGTNNVTALQQDRRRRLPGQGQQPPSQQQGQQGQPQQGPQGMPPVPRAIIVPETRTRSVIVRTKPSDFTALESLIKQLDSEGIDSLLEYKMVVLKNAQPSQVLRIVNQVVAQLDIVRPGDPVAVAADDRTRSLFVIARDVVMEKLEQIISELDSETDTAEMEVKVYPLKYVSGNQMRTLLQNLFDTGTATRAGARSRDNRSDYVRRLILKDEQGKDITVDLTKPIKVITDPSSSGINRVIVGTTQSNVAALDAVIAQLDKELPEDMNAVRIVSLKNADATSLASSLQRLISERTRQRAQMDEARTVIIPDSRSNSLIIGGSNANMELVLDLAQKLDDADSALLNNIRIIPLEYATAQRLSATLTTLFQRRTSGGGRGGAASQRNRTIIIPDARSNSLLVAAGEEDNKLIDRLLLKLDKQQENANLEPAIISLEKNDATRLAATIRSVFAARLQAMAQAGQQPDPQDRVSVEADSMSNSLIVTASKENMEVVRNLVERLDQESMLDNIRIIPLEYATAQRLSATLTTLFQRRTGSGNRGGASQRNRTIIIPDARSNSLLVAAGEEDNKLIDELLSKLDKQSENTNLEPTVIPLEQNDSTRLAATIRSVFAARLQAMAQSGQQLDPQDRVNVDADTMSNSLIVTASKENMEVVQDLVKRLDQEPTAEGLVQTITLQYADVQRVSTMLRTLIQQGVYRPGSTTSGKRGGGQRDSFAVVPDIPSNTLVVSASPENLALAKELISEIDTPENQNATDIKTFTLQHARVDRLVTTLEQFFRNKSNAEQRAGIRERAMQVTMAADGRSNTLLVTAGKEDLDLLEKMLKELDVKDAESRMTFNIFPLKNSTASKMQTTLQRLFQNRPAQTRGVAVEPITIVADAWSNSLVIGTSPDDEEMVRSLIDQLDKPETDSIKVQVFPMVHADARRVSTTVQSLLRGQTGASYGGGTGPMVSVDERINAIIVSAGENDIKRLEELIKKLDTDQVDRVNEVRIFPLSFARASDMATILNATLNTNPRNLSQASTSRQSMLQFVTRTPDGKDLVSSALREGILITADTRSNALVVSAPVDYMEFLESMIKSMDQSSPQEAMIRIFSLQNADARQMATVLTALFRLQATSGAAAQRSVQYTLVKMDDDSASGKSISDSSESSAEDGGEKSDSSAVVGSAEQHALTVTVDLRTNTVLVGGTEHYVSLASEIIETLDAHPAQERTAKVYRLRNSRAADIETALKTFLQQDLNRTISILGQSAAGAAQTILDREVSIVAETVSNSLLISASPRYFSEVETLIKSLDQPLPQVLIQVVLAEVTLDSTTELGVEWSYSDSAGGTPFSVGTDFGIEDAVKSLGGFSTAVSGSKVNFLLRSLQEDGRLEVLSCPQILTADNVEAKINIGEKVPIVTGTRYYDTTQTSTYEYQDVGVILTVTPRISPDGTVKMEVAPEVSQLTSSNVEVSKGVNIPIISQRTANTTVSIQSGQSVMIGGLISTSDDARTKKVPWLGNIPVIGALFRNKEFSSDRKELLIVLTPQVITAAPSTETNAQDIMDMTHEGFKDSILQNDLGRDPLQKKVLNKIAPDGLENSNGTNSMKKIERKNYTKELLIDP